MQILPKAKNTDIVVQEVGREILIYDLLTNKAYKLNETSAVVFNHCDGLTAFDELKRRYRFTDDLIYLALGELNKENLLEDQSFASPLAGISRREAVKRVGLATMIALPVISSVIAPTSTQAQSIVTLANGQFCSGNNQCTSRQCGQQGFGPYCCSADDNETCATSNDCCSGVACTNNVCCQGAGRTCDTRNNQCCSGLSCLTAPGQTNGQCG